jgi:hypothetical protein
LACLPPDRSSGPIQEPAHDKLTTHPFWWGGVTAKRTRSGWIQNLSSGRMNRQFVRKTERLSMRLRGWSTPLYHRNVTVKLQFGNSLVTIPETARDSSAPDQEGLGEISRRASGALGHHHAHREPGHPDRELSAARIIRDSRPRRTGVWTNACPGNHQGAYAQNTFK